MNNSKKSIHNSGPLGMLVQSGQVKKVDIETDSSVKVSSDTRQVPANIGGSYFKTQTGLEFSENELTYVDPKECEPWQYANRLTDEMGDIGELVNSIRENKQLQPALIRPHPEPHGNIKYEIIFGRRRHQACLQLNVPFLVIKKNITNLQDAVANQDAENKFRKNVSNYSNAILYKKLLADGVFKNEKELAKKLSIPLSTLNDLMSFSKIPNEIVDRIPNIHDVSTSIVIKILSLLNQSKGYFDDIISVAHEIGKSISSPAKLENAVKQQLHTKVTPQKVRIVKSKYGKKLFSLRVNHKGLINIVLYKDFSGNLNHDDLCAYLSKYVYSSDQSGAPDELKKVKGVSRGTICESSSVIRIEETR